VRFTELMIPGVFLIEPTVIEDDRGAFVRLYLEDVFRDRGLNTTWIQNALAFNRRLGTLRGLHYQANPVGEIKLVRCTRGSLFDVLVDLRPASPAFGRWVSAILSAANRQQLYVPEGIAHGYQTLENDTEVDYRISSVYRAELQRGLRWDDAQVAIDWPPCDTRILSARDRTFPDLATCEPFC